MSAYSAGGTSSLGVVHGRRIQIAGSASPSTDPALVAYAHSLVRALVHRILNAGGGVVLGLGKEPRADGAPATAPSLTFDWTALEETAECFRNGCGDWDSRLGRPLVLVGSEKSESEIPDSRQALYDELLQSGRVDVRRIMAGSRSGAFLRERQASFGDALVVVGGGTGVEHLAERYIARRRPVVPLDLPIGASRDDGTGGGQRLAQFSRADPSRFLRFVESDAGQEGTALAGIATRKGGADPTQVADRVFGILARVARPVAFYVRLLNPGVPEFADVESFFRDVVDSVVGDAGMSRVEVGTDKSTHPFVNVEIFERLHFSSLAVVDVTGLRPNCFIELGYALGAGNRVLVTAAEGTPLPFDQQAIPCHFWKVGDPLDERKKSFAEFWQKHIERPPIVRPVLL